MLFYRFSCSMKNRGEMDDVAGRFQLFDKQEKLSLGSVLSSLRGISWILSCFSILTSVIEIVEQAIPIIFYFSVLREINSKHPL